MNLRLLPYGILSFAICSFGCQKLQGDKQIYTWDLVTQAKIYYESNKAEIKTTHQRLTGQSNLFRGRSFEPLWEKARTIGSDNRSVAAIPIKFNRDLFFASNLDRSNIHDAGNSSFLLF